MQYTPTNVAAFSARWLSEGEAAAYVGVPLNEFLEEVEAGIWPKPGRQTPSRTLWDRKLLDLTSDRMSGLEQPNPADLSKDLLDVDEAATLLRCGTDLVQRVPDSDLPVCRPGKKNLYFLNDVLAYALSKKPKRRGRIDEAAIERALKDAR